MRDEHRRDDEARGAALDRRGVPRAGAGRERRARAAGRVLADRARRVRRRGRAARRRRGAHGFGRTGKPFGFQHWDVAPDIITVAKGLASGYATIGAVIVQRAHREALRRARARVRPHVLRAPDRVRGGARDAEALRRRAAVRERRRRSGRCCCASSTRIAARTRASVRARPRPARGASRSRRRRRSGRRSARQLAARKLSLHVDGKRGTAIFAPPLCITEAELVAGRAQLRRGGGGRVRSARVTMAGSTQQGRRVGRRGARAAARRHDDPGRRVRPVRQRRGADPRRRRARRARPARWSRTTRATSARASRRGSRPASSRR